MSKRYQKRIMKEIKLLQKNQNGNNDINFHYTVEFDETNMNVFKMNVSISNFYDKDKKPAEQLNIYKDLKKLKVKDITFEIHMDEYPIKPPFVRILKPMLTGGYIMSGGNICMDLFGTKIWSAALTIENVMVMVVQLFKERDYVSLKKEDINKEYDLATAQKSHKHVIKGVHSNWNHDEDLINYKGM